MGNTASSSSSIRVIGNNGKLQVFSRPVRASELMRENPGQFVCDSNCLRVGCRVPGLVAGDELQAGRLYFILPMDLLYSVLTEDEMALFTCRAMAKKSRGYIGRRIFPVLSDFCLIPWEAKKIEEEPERWKAEEEEEEEDREAELCRHRSWRPALDTIEEDT